MVTVFYFLFAPKGVHDTVSGLMLAQQSVFIFAPRFFLSCLFVLASSARLNAATFTVINKNDAGSGSLRQAILDANASSGNDVIAFQISGVAPYTIIPLSALPPATESVRIDGTTQSGFSGRPIIELNGSSAGTAANGLLLLGGNCTVRGLVINRFGQAGIRMESNGGNIIEGNFIGTDLAGTNNFGNGTSGVTIFRCADNIIGGLNAASRNIISGRNPTGVYIVDGLATRNQVIGNFIGTDVTGTIPLGNTNGVVLSQAPYNQIGGPTSAARNIISGNSQSGVYLSGPGSIGNQIAGNFIGTDYSGLSAVRNLLDGITIFGAVSNVIGGTVGGLRNIVSGNSQRGIHVFGGASGNLVQGNYIGTDVSGLTGLGNGYSGMRIWSASGNVVGGTTDSARNVISGNGENGISISDTNANNVVQGNYIGTDATGTNALGNTLDGIFISTLANNNILGGTNSAAGNIISGNKQNGIFIRDRSAGNQIQNNFIGTDFTGKVALANANAGVLVESPGNNIGTPWAGNLISGNKQNGIYIRGLTATNNFVQGNYIGTDITGTVRLGNAFSGVKITNAPGNIVGGTSPEMRNLISASLQDSGIKIEYIGSSGNRIQGNYIGTDITGSLSLGNAQGGIYLYGAPANTIGGTIPGAGNLISGNTRVGISIGDPGANGNIVQGNFIGTKSDGDNALGNQWHNIEILNTSSYNVIGPGNRIAYCQTSLYAGVRVRDGCTNNSIRGNAIFSNAGLGIDLGVNGKSANDLTDPDNGANNLQNFPVLTSASGRYITTLNGTLNSAPNQNFTMDFYASAVADPTGYGEGQTWLGSKFVSTDINGNATYSVKFTNSVPVDRIISATATDSANNSSEFSLAISIPASTTDSDGDGMSDEFEIANGFDPNNNSDAALDADADGMTNLQEFMAGTNPRDAADALRFLSPEKMGANVRLSFESVKDKSYRIEYTTGFSGWMTLPGNANISGTGFLIQITDALSNPNRFYRLRLL